MKTAGWIILALGVIVIIGVGYFLINSGKSYTSQTTPSMNPQTTTTTTTTTQTTTTTPTQTTPVTTTPSKTDITIQNFAFSPSSVTIKAGSAVVWTNQDSAPHTIVSDSGSEISSSSLSTGQTYSHTFNSAGTYTYHCSIHPSMKGTVIVTA